MPDEAPEDPPTAMIISRIVSYSAAVAGGLLIVIASYVSTGGDWLAPMSFRDLIAVPMWMPFTLGLAVLAFSVLSLIGPVRLLIGRSRSRREPGRPG